MRLAVQNCQINDSLMVWRWGARIAMLRSEPQGDIGLTARAEERQAGCHLGDHSQGKVSVHLQWLQEAGTRLSKMSELWRTKVGGMLQELS